jgi:predicted type IV restriction endonuclease
MYEIALPKIDVSIRKEGGKVYIFDIIRKKYVVLTPEEWVRQHMIHYLIESLHYPKSLFRIEGSLTFNKLQKRSDILIYDRAGLPWMLIECKAPTIKLSQKTFNQVAVYNMTIGAQYLVVSNGRVHFCSKASQDGTEAVHLSDFPAFG